jgi:signal transduction histidine kinase
MLTGLGLITQNLHKRMAARDLPEAEDVGEVSELIKEADQFARGLARGLVPVDLSEAGLAAAIARLADNAEKLFGIRVPFDLVGTVAVLDPTVATHLFRIAQEALSNAVKHGKARHVKISLAAGARQVRLRIYDDGVGFPDEASSEPTGMGVRIMRHRARVIGANLDIGGNAEGGTTITCTVRNINQPSPMGGQEYAKDVL